MSRRAGGKWYSLWDKVCNRRTLEASWVAVARNHGAAGVDGVSIQRFAAHAERYLDEIAADLKAGRYRPDDVRRTYIPKTGGGQRPLGPTPTTHILKLPMGVMAHSGMDLRDSCENEWLCLKIAQAFGLPACHAEVRHFDAIKVLVVERFDRGKTEGWIMRLPQEDFCQALGYSPNLKYESDGGPGVAEIMRLLQHSCEAKQDRAQWFASLVLFWRMAAIDGHAKNFSVFIEAEGRFRLTPLYDIISAHPLIASQQVERQKIKMAMALHGKNRHYHWHSLQPRHYQPPAGWMRFAYPPYIHQFSLVAAPG